MAKVHEKRSKIARVFRVEPGSKFQVKDHTTDVSRFKDLRKATGEELNSRARAHLEETLADRTGARNSAFRCGCSNSGQKHLKGNDSDGKQPVNHIA